MRHRYGRAESDGTPVLQLRGKIKRLAPRQRWTWRKRGQAIIIFALTITFLIGLTGLAIDVIRAYDLYAREHRAAEAGALAGDLYMPCFYNTVSSANGCGPGVSPGNPPGQSTAIKVALGEVQLNGFGQGVNPPSSCTGFDTSQPVTICVNNTGPTALQVTVSQPINVFFLSVLGISGFTVSATAAADYLPNTILGSGGGSGGNVWGSGGVSNPQTFLDVINGPAEFQEQGDPFVYCQDGPTVGPPPDLDFSTSITPLLDSTTGSVAGFPTNHAPFLGPPECGTSKDPNNLQAANLTGTLTPGGNDVYSFQMSPGSGTSADVYIWNPMYDPSDQQSNSCNGATTPDTFFFDQSCSAYYAKYGPIVYDGTHFDDPRLYFNMTYTVYSVAPVYGTGGTLYINPQTFAPLDLYKADVAAHCTSGNAYQLPDSSQPENSTYTGGVTPGACGTLGGPGFMVGAWVKLGSIVGGTYRLTAEATARYPEDGCGTFTCGWGRHTFTVAVCAPGTSPSGGSCTSPGTGAYVSPINDADVYLNFPSGTQNGAIPFANIPVQFAGRTITFSVFNPGYTRANAPNTYFTIVPPDCSPINIPTTSTNWYRVVSNQGIPSAPPCTGKGNGSSYNWVFSAARGKGGSGTGDFIYHGLWTDITVAIPSSYATATNTQWWFSEIVGQGSKDFGQICLKVSVNGGSPVHLIL